MKLIDFLKLILSIVISECAGIIGAFFTTPAIPVWYSSLNKPLLNPPSWIFGSVWTTLFALMGVASFLVWSLYKESVKKRKKQIKFALYIFAAQLILNTLWSIIFFGLKNPGLAFMELVILWFAILGTIIVFAKISRPAAWLLIPYILWVTFAGYLNYSIWRLSNKAEVIPEAIYCTQEAKLCPDGSYVGRTGPNCEFKLCPEDETLSWKIFTNSVEGFSFKYPEKLSTLYIDALDWPPRVELFDALLNCAPAGLETGRAGKTEEITINGQSFCVTSVTQGAAGSLYTQYAYAFPKDGKTVIFTFSLRKSQCGNYEDPQKTECQTERDSFDIGKIIGGIVNTFQFQ